jgi:hypothetical protein
MPKKNLTVVKRVVGAGAAFVGVLALSASAGAAPVTPFREVAVVNGPWAASVESDGARYAWLFESGSSSGRVFDTLRRRSFRLAAPRPGCTFVSIGGGLAVWSCASPRGTMLLTNLSTGRSRKPAGIDQIERGLDQVPYISCYPVAIGRYWIPISCGAAIGDRSTQFLNHRTGRLTKEIDLFSADLPFIDLDYVGLFRQYCAPLARPSDGAHDPPYFDYAPPFALHAPLGPGPDGHWTRFDSIRLRRCGTKRAEILTRCPQTDCRSPQLGSRYVTWGEHKRVYAYLPRIRRRILVGRAPAGFVRGRKLNVAHTCDRIFARWGDSIYDARFAPRHGAPPCQHRG